MISKIYCVKLTKIYSMKKSENNMEVKDLKDYNDWIKEGNQHLKNKEYMPALRCYDNALELNSDDAKIWDNRGVALSGAGRYEAAIESFEISLDLKPDNSQAWSNMGVSMAALRRFEEAINCFNHALDIKPDDANTWNNRGTAFFTISLSPMLIKASITYF